jgi:transposase
MRGEDILQESLFSYLSCEARVPAEHPLRRIRVIVDAALERLDGTFGELYSERGRPSIPPEKLIRALLLQAFYSVRSERQLMEQLDYNLLFRWFVGLGIDDTVWDASTFSKNRDRLLAGDVAKRFLRVVLQLEEVKGLLSDEHFSVDGSLIEAYASHKSLRPREEDSDTDGDDASGGGRNAEVNFRGERRRNATHISSTDPDATLYRKSHAAPAKLCYLGHVLMENRHGLLVDSELTQAGGLAERQAAVSMLRRQGKRRRRTLGADKGYDSGDFILALRTLKTTPHVAQNTSNRRSAIDERTARHRGYEISQRIRKRIEESFGWMKEVGRMRKTRHRGKDRVGWQFDLVASAYNLIRLPKLLAVAA